MVYIILRNYSCTMIWSEYVRLWRDMGAALAVYEWTEEVGWYTKAIESILVRGRRLVPKSDKARENVLLISIKWKIPCLRYVIILDIVEIEIPNMERGRCRCLMWD